MDRDLQSGARPHVSDKIVIGTRFIARKLQCYMDPLKINGQQCFE